MTEHAFLDNLAWLLVTVIISVQAHLDDSKLKNLWVTATIIWAVFTVFELFKLVFPKWSKHFANDFVDWLNRKYAPPLMGGAMTDLWDSDYLIKRSKEMQDIVNRHTKENNE